MHSIRYLNLSFLLALLVLSCNKSTEELKQELLENSPKPKTITINYYEQGFKSYKFIYKPDYTSKGDTIRLFKTDTAFWDTRGGRSFSDISWRLIRNRQSGLVSDYHIQNLRTSALYYDPSLISYKNTGKWNLSAKMQSTFFQGEHSGKLTIKSYMDAEHTEEYRSNTTNIISKNYQGIFFADIYNEERNGFIYLKKDTIYIEDTKEPLASGPYRYFKYYQNEVPFYKQQNTNKALYHIQSPFVCDSFILQNGTYSNNYIGDFEYETIFHPGLKRKTTYTYNQDTTQLKEIIPVFNLIAWDPLWYYVGYFADFDDRTQEVNDYYGLYSWMASSYSDSVFVFSNGQPVLKQVNFTTNQVEKDQEGRIIKITHRPGNLDYYKVMEITY